MLAKARPDAEGRKIHPIQRRMANGATEALTRHCQVTPAGTEVTCGAPPPSPLPGGLGGTTSPRDTAGLPRR